MIRCNLAVLLAERNLKITRVSKETGISRTTLTSLANNKGQGIQFDTINTLCSYLGVLPNEIIHYIPYEIQKSITPRTTVHNDLVLKGFNIDLTIFDRAKKEKFSLYTDAITESNLEDEVMEIKVNLYLYDHAEDEDIKEGNLALIEYLRAIPTAFLQDLQNEITEEIVKKTLEDNGKDDKKYFVQFSWPEEFYEYN